MLAERERFWSKVDKNGPNGCWLWLGAPTRGGYAQFQVGYKNHRVHRYAYEQLVGPIPDGFQLDHLCRVRNCVNPAHLEPVTQAENIRRGYSEAGLNARKTHCKRGHEFTEANTIRRSDGGRACRECQRAHQRTWRQRVAISPTEESK